MDEGKGLHNLLLMTGAIGLVVLGLVFDLILQALLERNAEIGTLDATLVWIFPLLQFLFIVALVGLVWFMIASGGYSRWVSVIYLLIGLILLYYNPILYTNELPDILYVAVQYLAPGTMLIQAGAAVAAIGLLSLWFWKAPPKEDALPEEPGESEAGEEPAA